MSHSKSIRAVLGEDSSPLWLVLAYESEADGKVTPDKQKASGIKGKEAASGTSSVNITVIGLRSDEARNYCGRQEGTIEDIRELWTPERMQVVESQDGNISLQLSHVHRRIITLSPVQEGDALKHIKCAAIMEGIHPDLQMLLQSQSTHMYDKYTKELQKYRALVSTNVSKPKAKAAQISTLNPSRMKRVRRDDECEFVGDDDD
ncbi:hypothetical protein K437DRAFT_267587 [Tilletiaria anomala UBC 951]|uniref:Uncharacterized protein n=1 Tax=Tilletiaria anomala (strain ATCC 24038 / CBS 436.72 / UBC 951) TaxID=1037660 RepID=A0A066W7K2_TILAU|nr:uncharacterized protein K437DRAFT_267587 [Tilletiaria anomala UBC 951]KDN48518.1 hypothetical protein K437DRAFT_267587 [Tilletiaria anomala UBC 951]